MGLTRINNQALTDVTSAGLPSGTVLQVKTFKTTTKGTVSGSASAWGDVLSGSITPSSTNSTIYITGHAMIANPQSSGALEMGLKIIRDSTDFFIGDNGSNNSQTETSLSQQLTTAGYETWTPSWHCYDTPNTISAVTYKLQVYGSESESVKINQPRATGNDEWVMVGTTSLILMEIAG